MSLTLLLMIITGGIAALLVGKSLFNPAKLALKLMVNSVFGLAVLWLVNFAGALLGLNIPLNPFTVMVTGVLGLPGLTMLGLLQVVTR